MSQKTAKPLLAKAYGHIAHLPGSRLGPGDHRVHDGQARICTEKKRDRHDVIIVQEKTDGSCCAVALLNGEIVPLVRSGYPAISSRFEQHAHFHNWVWQNRHRFLAVLKEGERLCGEWLCQAHGTRYDSKASGWEPFVAFDLMRGIVRMASAEFSMRVSPYFVVSKTLHVGDPLSIQDAMDLVINKTIEGHYGHHAALEPVEGVVYRVERKGVVDFLAKFVRPEKVDGLYLPEISGQGPVWNWRPEP